MFLLCTVVSAYYPVVIWHGMGDTCCNPQSIGKITQDLQSWLPGTFVHSIKIGATEDQDRNAGYFDMINRQVDEVCEHLKSVPELEHGFNGLGISQGGLFLRAYVQRCNDPPIKSLMTLGSPHAGVMDLPKCEDFTCRTMRSIVKQGVYLDWVQNRIVQAQYFKQVPFTQKYLEHNIFLPDLNNELEFKKEYQDRLSSLTRLVLVRFSEDEMVTPRDSAWFSFYDDDMNLVPLQGQAVYPLLKQLDTSGRIYFETMQGGHLHLEGFEALVKTHFSDTQSLLGYVE
ncbi:Alpha/Beta hydrolase protein [Gorgonomyces haynaldii]|nr:Alpha/Beta hydrolase protein [Gorgonomyces haynaldii]